jgi:putative phosphoribosyl transferase
MKQYKNIIKNRRDAATQLMELIPRQKFKDEAWEVVAISAGGLELGSYFLERYTNNIHYLLSESIYAPNNDSCEIARVSEQEEIVVHEDLVASFNIQYDYVYGEAHRKYEEKILSSIYKYRKGKAFPSMKGKVVILVDEGSETGLKMMLAIKTVLAMKPKAVYLAVGVLPSDVLELLETFVDNLYYLHSIDDFVETALYYEELPTVSDEKIENILEDK